MRKLIKRTAGWIHATLIMAMILPLFYAFGADASDSFGQNLFYKCLLIALPVAVTDLAVKRCKGLLSYLVVSAFIFVATIAISWYAAGVMRQSWIFGVYMVHLPAETMAVIVLRIADRLRKKREKDDWDETAPSPAPSVDRLSTPSFPVLIYFVLVYVTALNLNNPAVCNAALFSAVIYTVTTFVYKHVCGTEEYLALNKRTCNIPSKRIYGIGNGMLMIFLLLLAVVMLPSLLTIQGRHYRDLRKSTAPISIYDVQMAEEHEREPAGPDPMERMMELYGEPKPAPEWLDHLFNILAAVIFLAFMGALIKYIRDTFHVFRESADENGDVVEELRETNEGVKIKKAYVSRRRLSERERIRKEYRRLIRRHRKERPACYESPAEIERNAGIAESEESKELHRQYELARYGQEG